MDIKEQELDAELYKLNQNSSTRQKISNKKAIKYANSIFTAIDGLLTKLEDIYSVFSNLCNDADYLAVSKAFGVRTMIPNQKATMEQALHADLDLYERKSLNDILSSKGIKYKI